MPPGFATPLRLLPRAYFYLGAILEPISISWNHPGNVDCTAAAPYSHNLAARLWQAAEYLSFFGCERRLAGLEHIVPHDGHGIALGSQQELKDHVGAVEEPEFDSS